MWICLNDAFVSIVADAKDPTILKVRARRRNHLRVLFPGAKIHRDEKADYRFRVFVPREDVAKVIAEEVRTIAYGNFKNSTKDHDLHDMYSLWWGDHRKLQEPKGKKIPEMKYDTWKKLHTSKGKDYWLQDGKSELVNN